MSPASRLVVASVEPADLPALADLMAAAPLLHRYATTRASALAALERGQRAGDHLLAARSGHDGSSGKPVGLAWVIPSRILTGAAYLRLLLVARDHQGAGVGGRLLHAAEVAASAWANHMVLLVTTDNVQARRFYEHAAYRHVGDIPGLAVPALDEALYWKALRPHDARLPV